MLARKLILAAAVLVMAGLTAGPISADQDPALFHLRAIADRPDVMAALNRYDDLAALSDTDYRTAWELDMLRVQLKLQSEVFGAP